MLKIISKTISVIEPYHINTLLFSEVLNTHPICSRYKTVFKSLPQSDSIAGQLITMKYGKHDNNIDKLQLYYFMSPKA